MIGAVLNILLAALGLQFVVGPLRALGWMLANRAANDILPGLSAVIRTTSA